MRKETTDMIRKIRLNSIGDVKELADIATNTTFPVFGGNETISINVASILGALSLNLNATIQLEYEGKDERLEAFVEKHEEA